MATTTPQKIGTYYFLSMSGEIGAYGETVAEITRPGKHSYDLKKLGKRGDAFTLKTISSHSLESNAKTAVADYEKLKTTVVAVKKNYQEYANVLILDARSRIIEPTLISDGNDFLVETAWTMKRIADG